MRFRLDENLGMFSREKYVFTTIDRVGLETDNKGVLRVQKDSFRPCLTD